MERSTLAVIDDITSDDFLGGKLTVRQPRTGYRAGVDAVLLAAATPAKPGQSILELGCGVGVAALCLSARVPDLQIKGLEIQPAYAELCRQNAQANGANIEVLTGDLRQMPSTLRQLRFDHVIMNPPYFDRATGNASQNKGRDIALGGDTPLADWLDQGARRVGPKGYLTLIQRIERLPEVLTALGNRLGSVIVRPIAGRAGKPANLFLLQARQEGRAAFQLAPALLMHEGAAHMQDTESYTKELQTILRNGASLSMTV